MNKLYKQLYKYLKIIFTKRMWKICERKRNNANANDKKGYTSTKAPRMRNTAVTFTYASEVWWQNGAQIVLYIIRNVMPEMNHIKITI